MTNGGEGIPTSRETRDSDRKTTVDTGKFYRYGVIELGSYADVRTFEKLLRKWLRAAGRKTKNVSPDAGRIDQGKGKKKQRVGVAFTETHADLWPDYKKAVKDADYFDGSTVEPEWWYLSGHHGEFGDDGLYGDKGQYGFFNNEFYHAPYPITAAVPGAVFMNTSSAENTGAKILAVQKKPNPLYDKPPHANCKGVFLIGCNTLNTQSIRDMYGKFFPAGVVIGYYHAKAPGPDSQQNKHLRAIFRAIRKTTPSFFEDPQGYFDRNGGQKDGAYVALQKIMGQVSKTVRKREMVAIYKKKVYIPGYDWAIRCWRHYYVGEKLAPGGYAICEVPGKANPFVYTGANKQFVKGVKGGKNRAKLAEHFRYSEFRKLPGFTKVDVFLVNRLNHIRSYVDTSVVPKEVRDGGLTLAVSCTKKTEFLNIAKSFVKPNRLTKADKLDDAGNFIVSVA